MVHRCVSCPPRDITGHSNLSEQAVRVKRVDGVEVYAYKCIVCGTFWNRYYEGHGAFRWSSVGVTIPAAEKP